MYRFRNNELNQLTQDHALVGELVEKGILSPKEALGHPQSNLETRAVGATERLYLDTEIFDLAHDDYFVLCSDGLDKELSEEDIAEIVNHETIETMSDVLMDMALHRGARDSSVCSGLSQPMSMSKLAKRIRKGLVNNIDRLVTWTKPTRRTVAYCLAFEGALSTADITHAKAHGGGADSITRLSLIREPG